ncbi:hypothetical protein ACWCPQ_25220 [Nocardia sp. NPDC001965]
MPTTLNTRHRASKRRRPPMTLAVLGCLAAALVAGCETTPHHTQTTVTPSAPATKPSELRWEAFQGVRLPRAQQGPTHIDGAVAAGFDRSPAGAALAAIHATVRMSVATDSQWSAVVQHMLAPGPGRDTWATARAQISITTPITVDPPAILGYRITGYTPDIADLDIYTLHPDNSLTDNTSHVRWHAEDWRLELPHNPATSPVRVLTLPPHDMVALTPR